MHPDWNRWVAGTWDPYFSFYPLTITKKKKKKYCWVNILSSCSISRAGLLQGKTRHSPHDQRQTLPSQPIARMEWHIDIKNNKYNDYTAKAFPVNERVNWKNVRSRKSYWLQRHKGMKIMLTVENDQQRPWRDKTGGIVEIMEFCFVMLLHKEEYKIIFFGPALKYIPLRFFLINTLSMEYPECPNNAFCVLWAPRQDQRKR